MAIKRVRDGQVVLGITGGKEQVISEASFRKAWDGYVSVVERAE